MSWQSRDLSALTMRKILIMLHFSPPTRFRNQKVFPSTPEGKRPKPTTNSAPSFLIFLLSTDWRITSKFCNASNFGSWKERGDTERELNTGSASMWPTGKTRLLTYAVVNRCAGKIEVSDVEGTGWYQVALSVRPHFKYMGHHLNCPGGTSGQGISTMITERESGVVCLSVSVRR